VLFDGVCRGSPISGGVISSEADKTVTTIST
jgi:hypothetical protein